MAGIELHPDAPLNQIYNMPLDKLAVEVFKGKRWGKGIT